MLTAERFQLDLLLAEAPPDVLPDLPGVDELLVDAAARARSLGGEYAGWYGWDLAEQLFRSGRLSSSKSVTVWLLVQPAGLDGFELLTPRIRILRTEIARRKGLWGEADSELEACERALEAINSFAQEPKSQASYDESLARKRQAYYEDLARLRGLQAQVQLELGLLDRAKHLLDEARSAAQKSGTQSADLATRLVYVDWLLLQEKFQEVIDEVQPSRLADGPATPLFLLVEGLASLELEREGKVPDTEAAELFRMALAEPKLEVAQSFAARVYLADALFVGLARHPGDADRESQVRDALSRARELARKTWRPDELPEEGGVLAAVEWRYAMETGGAEEQGRLLHAYDRLHDADPPDALRSWTLRSLELQAQRLRVVSARDHVLEAYDDLLAAWSSNPPRPGGLGFLQWQVRRTRVISAAVDADLVSSPGEPGKRAAVERLFQVQTMGSSARGLDLQPCSLDEVRTDLLAPGEGCLVFLPAPDVSHLFTFDGATLEHHALPEVDVLQPLLEDDRVNQGDAGEKAARKLRDALLPGGVRSWIEAHDALTLVGFELLPGLHVEELPPWKTQPAETSPPEIGARFAVASLPSVPFLLHLARRAQARKEPAEGLVLAVNADPHGAAKLEPFTFGDEEMRALSKPFREHARCITGASRADLAGLSQERHAIVHVLCHGAWDHGKEVGAALILASKGGADFVHADELPPLDVDVLVLTACGADRGPLRIGDDLAATLGGQALAKGASCVLVGDGRVEVAAALKMGEALIRELAAGASPAEALRRATAEMPEQAKQARYRVLGLGHTPLDAGD
jgi:hypothetical protein